MGQSPTALLEQERAKNMDEKELYSIVLGQKKNCKIYRQKVKYFQ